MGVVYEATQVSLHRLVALKLLTPELGLDGSFRTRFQREGRIQAAIDHAHIVPIYDSGELEGHGLFIAMRLVRGPTLKELILTGELEPERALRILAPVADALDTAHEADLVHRDIKPQNILVGPRDHAYLADFGLTRAPGDTAFTKTGQFVGTLDYIAPEQIRGEPALGASDVYSLACVAFECLTGSVPYPRSTEASVMFAHLTEDPPRACAVREELPPEVDEVLSRGMAKDPSMRPETALRFIQELAEAVPASASGASSASHPQPAAPPPTTEAPATTEAPPPPRAAPSTAASPTPVAPALPAPPAPAPATVAAGEATEPHTRMGMSTIADHRRPWPEEQVAEARDAPAPKSARPRSPIARRRAVFAAAAVAVLAIAGTAGAFAAGGKGDDGKARAKPSPGPALRAGALTVRAPAGWRAATTPELPGLQLDDASAAAPAAGAAAGLVIGTSAASGASLLPAGLTSRLSGEPDPEAVRLGNTEALRHSGLRPRGYDRPLTVFAVPTTRGVATVACLGEGTALKACEAAATSLRLSAGARAYAIGPRADYARGVTRVTTRLAADRKAALADWRKARTRRQEGTAAQALSTAYARAGRSMEHLDISPLERAANDDAVRALAATGSTLHTVAAAARRGDRRAYDRARTTAGRRGAAAAKAIDALGDVGYRVS
jgi:serine/threonine-protein kinase